MVGMKRQGKRMVNCPGWIHCYFCICSSYEPTAVNHFHEGILSCLLWAGATRLALCASRLAVYPDNCQLLALTARHLPSTLRTPWALNMEGMQESYFPCKSTSLVGLSRPQPWLPILLLQCSAFWMRGESLSDCAGIPTSASELRCWMQNGLNKDTSSGVLLQWRALLCLSLCWART